MKSRNRSKGIYNPMKVIDISQEVLSRRVFDKFLGKHYEQCE